MESILVRYNNFLPVTPDTPLLTIGEGNTPLIRSKRLEKEIGVGELYFKLECLNPTGSFKDRGMVLTVAKAKEEGSSALICASTGNTSASASAYGALYGLDVFVLVPKGYVALGKLSQALIYGAKVINVDGNFDKALELVLEIVKRHPVTLVNSLNPYRIEGQKTAAFEIVDALGGAPDYLFIPVGNAGNITAYWKGFKEYKTSGNASKTPKMMGFEAEGSAAIVKGKPIANPSTVATAIRIGNPASWKRAEEARDESGGVIDFVTDEEILASYKLLATKEGIFGEPASAASVAGLIKSVKGGLDLANKRCVCVITGTGLKDPDTALKSSQIFAELPAELSAVEKVVVGTTTLT